MDRAEPLVVPRQRHHACVLNGVVATQDLKTLTLYVDGKRAASAGSFNQNGPHGFAISHNMQANSDALKGTREWDGIFDEARVMSVLKDANWALLDFESQKEGSKFLSVGPAAPK